MMKMKSEHECSSPKGEVSWRQVKFGKRFLLLKPRIAYKYYSVIC